MSLSPSKHPRVKRSKTIRLPKSRRLDSHQYDPAYEAGAYAVRATSATSRSARIRTLSHGFGDHALSQEHAPVETAKPQAALAEHRPGIEPNASFEARHDVPFTIGARAEGRDSNPHPRGAR